MGISLYLFGVIMGIIPLFIKILVMFFMLAFTINTTISVVFIMFFFYILVVAFLSSKFVKIIATKINKIDDLTIEVSSDVLAKNVYLFSDENIFFSDNYFDVLPNEKVIIKLSKPVKNVVVKSLFDTLK